MLLLCRDGWMDLFSSSQEGADYMYRVNDDSQFMTTFAKHLVAELQNHCPPNVGVTGPTCHEGNTGILTHDFTHRHHMQIFNRQ